MAACVSAAVALEWPTETRTPRAVAWAASSARSGKFRRERHQPHLAFGGIVELVEDCDVGREQMSSRLHAAFGMGEKRSFEMNADGPRLAGNRGLLDDLRQSRESLQRGVERRCHGSREKGCRAARG